MLIHTLERQLSARLSRRVSCETEDLITEEDEIEQILMQEAIRQKRASTILNKDNFHEFIQNHIAEARAQLPVVTPLDLRDLNKEIADLVVSHRSDHISLYPPNDRIPAVV